MRIATRYLLFKILVGAAAANYLLFLYDVSINESAFFVPVMGAFVGIIVLTLVLYLGVKPAIEDDEILAVADIAAVPDDDDALPGEAPLDAEALDEATLIAPMDGAPDAALPAAGEYAKPPSLPPPIDEAPEIVQEIPRPTTKISSIDIPEKKHHFRCPFCSHVFSVEASQDYTERDLRINCPYCANDIRIPAKPRIVVGEVPQGLVDALDQAAFQCRNCGEVLRFSAPESSIRRRLHIQACPNCGSYGVDPATVAG